MPPGLFRLFLATLVFIDHMTRFSVGLAAVYVFFILSGYWIAQMWSDKYSLGRKPYLTFVMSRMWRLWPTFLLINALTIFAHRLAGESIEMSARALLSNLILLGYSSMSSGKFLLQAWSLDIEIQFYLTAPAILYFIAWKPRAVWPVAAILGSVTLAFLAFQVDPMLGTVLPYAAFFVIGIAAQRFAWSPSMITTRASALSALGIVVVGLALPETRGMFLRGASANHLLFRYNGAICVVLALIAAPAALRTVYERSPGWDKMTGDLSYIVYLLHWVVAWIIHAHWGNLPTLARAPYVAAGFIAVYAGGILIWRFFDRPINDLRAAYIRRLTTPPVSLAPAQPR